MAIKHPLCRPAYGYRDLKRLTDNNRWAKDDGKPAVAFVGVDFDDPNAKDGTAAIVLVADCKCVGAACPRTRAMSYAAEHYDVATVSVLPRARKSDVITLPVAKIVKRTVRSKK